MMIEPVIFWYTRGQNPAGVEPVISVEQKKSFGSRLQPARHEAWKRPTDEDSDRVGDTLRVPRGTVQGNSDIYTAHF